MNQILQVNDNKKQLKPINAKKIILFLLIAVIILGLGIGGYLVYQNIINGNIKLPIFIEEPQDTIAITLTQADRNKLAINVQSETGLSKITYTLNNGEPQVIELEGETTVEETIIDIPVGENAINISVTDINGEETIKQENFVVEAPKPVIDLSVVGNDIKITVTSEVDIEEITYKWNSDDEKKENMKTYEDKKSFEKKLNIPIGQNTLTIVAIDIDGSKTEKVQEIKGVTRATTTVKVLGEYWHFTVKAKENISAVEFEFNGQKYLMNTNTFGETKIVHYKVKLIEGINYLTVRSVTQSGGAATESFEQKYTIK